MSRNGRGDLNQNFSTHTVQYLLREYYVSRTGTVHTHFADEEMSDVCVCATPPKASIHWTTACVYGDHARCKSGSVARGGGPEAGASWHDGTRGSSLPSRGMCSLPQSCATADNKLQS